MKDKQELIKNSIFKVYIDKNENFKINCRNE